MALRQSRSRSAGWDEKLQRIRTVRASPVSRLAAEFMINQLLSDFIQAIKKAANPGPGLLEPHARLGAGEGTTELRIRRRLGSFVLEELAAGRIVEMLAHREVCPGAGVGGLAVPRRVVGAGRVEPGAIPVAFQLRPTRRAAIITAVPGQPPQRPARANRTRCSEDLFHDIMKQHKNGQHRRQSTPPGQPPRRSSGARRADRPRRQSRS